MDSHNQQWKEYDDSDTNDNDEPMADYGYGTDQVITNPGATDDLKSDAIAPSRQSGNDLQEGKNVASDGEATYQGEYRSEDREQVASRIPPGGYRPRNKDVLLQDDTLYRDIYAVKMTRKELADKLREDKLSKTEGQVRVTKMSTMTRATTGIKDSSRNFRIWRSSLKEIEGNFGSAVVSYFYIVRWLMLINFFVSMVTLGAIIVPHELLQPRVFEDSLDLSGTESFPQFHEAKNCSIRYKNHLHATEQSSSSATYRVIDFLQGTGWMENTVLFMGYYFDKTVAEPNGTSTRVYNIPIAFLFTPALYMLTTLILMVYYTAEGIKTKYVDKDGVNFYKHFKLIFCGWDFSLDGQKSAAEHHNRLRRLYNVEIRKYLLQKERMGRSRRAKCCLLLIRMTVHLLVFAILVSCFALIYYVFKFVPNLLAGTDGPPILILLYEYLPTITITFLNAAVPIVFGVLIRLEKYTPERRITWSLVRTVVLRLASIGSLVIIIGSIITNCTQRICGNCPSSTDHEDMLCWETYVGQQFYRLAILDFIIQIVFLIFVEVPLKIIYEKCKSRPIIKTIAEQEFDISKNVLDIVYAQMISWVGGFFCPLLPLITTVKFVVLFYCKKVSLFYTCARTGNSSGAARINHIFIFVLLIAFALCAFTIAYAVGRIPTSQGCGPFRVYTKETFIMYDSIENAISQLTIMAQDFLHFIGSWIFIVPITLSIILFIGYNLGDSASSKTKADFFCKQLAMVSRDKQYLISRSTQG